MSALENIHYGFEHHLKWLSPQIFEGIGGDFGYSRGLQPAKSRFSFLSCEIDSTLIQWHRIRELIGSEPDSE